MHIAMIAGEYPPRWGGIGSVVYHLAGHLASFGHQVTVITRADDIKAPAQSGVNIVEVPWLKLPMKFTRSYAKNAFKIIQRLHAEDPFDVIHVHLPLASFTAKEYRFLEQNIAPVCCSLHGSWLGEKVGVLRAASAGESAIWRNPNDLAIRLGAKWYARTEKLDCSIPQSAWLTPNRPCKSSVTGMHLPEITMQKWCFGDAITKSSGQQISTTKKNNSLTSDFDNSMVVMMKKL
ncbi:MAG: hypothetical protein CM15mP2_0490 [Methanobacteriota archaeon]|nr:MAG: hypothetical protein CM15mP2_0490 [Euryarchaeota archaeon]